MADQSIEASSAEAIQILDIPIEEFVFKPVIFSANENGKRAVFATTLGQLLPTQFLSHLKDQVTTAHIRSDDESPDVAYSILEELKLLAKSAGQSIFVTLAGPVYRREELDAIHSASTNATATHQSEQPQNLQDKFTRIDLPEELVAISGQSNGDVALLRALLLAQSIKEDENVTREVSEIVQIIHLPNISINSDFGDVFVIVPRVSEGTN